MKLGPYVVPSVKYKLVGVDPKLVVMLLDLVSNAMGYKIPHSCAYV